MNDSLHTVEWIVEDHIGHLVMNQPPANSMTGEFFHDMGMLKKVIMAIPDLKAILIYGKGRHFSSGADLDELLLMISSGKKAWGSLMTNYTAISFFESLPCPVISLIKGVCLGSAFELALFSHFRFCSNEAVFGLPETTLNLIPGIGGIQRFANLAGKATALDFILTGRTFDAKTACSIGVVDKILPKQELLIKSTEFARWLPENYNPALKSIYLERYLKSETEDVRGET